MSKPKVMSPSTVEIDALLDGMRGQLRGLDRKAQHDNVAAGVLCANSTKALVIWLHDHEVPVPMFYSRNRLMRLIFERWSA